MNKRNKIMENAIEDEHWLAEAEERVQNEDWLGLSAAIALKTLRYLRKNGSSQKELAGKMNCSPQYLNKVLKGRENLTLETICKLQSTTGLQLIEVPYAAIRAKYNQNSTDAQVKISLHLNKGIYAYSSLENDSFNQQESSFPFIAPKPYSSNESKITSKFSITKVIDYKESTFTETSVPTGNNRYGMAV